MLTIGTLLVLLACAIGFLAARKRPAWLRIAIGIVAFAVVSQYVTTSFKRTAMAQASARRNAVSMSLRNTLQVRKVPSLPNEAQEVSITYSVPCAGLAESPRNEICTRAGPFPDAILTRDTRRLLRERFSQSISLQVWSPQQPLRGATEPLRYIPRDTDVTELVITSERDYFTITRTMTSVVPLGNAAAILPRVSVASAQVSVMFGSTGCADRCAVTAARIHALGRDFCAQDFRAAASDTFVARLYTC